MVTGGSESGMKPAILVEVVGGGVVVRGEGAGIYGLPMSWWASESGANRERSVRDAVL